MKYPTMPQLTRLARAILDSKLVYKKHWTCLSFFCQCNDVEYSACFNFMRTIIPAFSKNHLAVALRGFVNREVADETSK